MGWGVWSVGVGRGEGGGGEAMLAAPLGPLVLVGLFAVVVAGLLQPIGGRPGGLCRGCAASPCQVLSKFGLEDMDIRSWFNG